MCFDDMLECCAWPEELCFFQDSNSEESILKNLIRDGLHLNLNALQLTLISKKHFIAELDNFIKQQLHSNLRWYYNPLGAIEDLNTKLISTEHDMFSIRV